MNTTYLIVHEGSAILCLICDRTSSNANDVRNKFCGHCKVFHESHGARHMLLQRMFDELVADFISHTKGLPSSTSIMDLIMWSSGQIDNPTEIDHDKQTK